MARTPRKGGPAFPVVPPDAKIQGSSGMTYRQWLVGQAIAGCAHSGGSTSQCEHMAANAHRIADAVIAEGEKVHP
ncbi:hypothetical protein [Allomesorhizobium alhagi]|uniref:Uncharacterized protein n=1 Tax=Mesorhizobium alhagi CCNWXJ12-2 TaxID=1107882 RepID=H0HNL0_9HYPH|nr:hypothetical protein [Mesorhizobium alhagi]EHK57663.1 hypothetical protein MAXJ12_08664 [Mesorhizobium alhagi CCNWXJ12-2]